MPGSPSADWYYVGVDVGSGSVRAALVTRDGRVKATAEESITVWTPQPDYYEQSSEDIWRKCCNTVKKVTEGVEKDRVRGIGFDATCSLVVLDQNFQPVAVNKNGEQFISLFYCSFFFLLREKKTLSTFNGRAYFRLF
uniref:Carbohydrate kinase FGGY N-terminal domain-containing protein n=1 Tax=Astyanax mexicanus TaxID=7994 RepID=A0A8B9HJM9_ASTMX